MDVLSYLIQLGVFGVFFGIPFVLICGILWRIFKKLK